MFGYIKPYIPSLTVGEYEAYRGAYCGLCRTMGSLTGQVSRLTLNYDFAFLAVYRMALERIPAAFERKGCVAHPASRRNHMKRNPALEYCAAASAVLTAGKIQDDIADEKGFGRIKARVLSPVAKRMVKRVRKTVASLEAEIASDLEALSGIEKANEASLDAPANAFGALLSHVTSFGYEGERKMISDEIGRALGKIIYVLDAADDICDDVKCEKYNPLALLYDEPIDESDPKHPVIKKDIADELYTAIGIEANSAAAAFELVDEHGIGTYKRIVMNILTLGIRAEAERVLYGRGKREDPVKFKL